MCPLSLPPRSDVYSLGVILYELLTGSTPFDRETISKLGFDGFRKALKEQEPPRPSVRLSTVKAGSQSTLEHCRQLSTNEFTRKLKLELDWVVMKALEKDRERRYESATAFAADVQRYLHNEPVLAYLELAYEQRRDLFGVAHAATNASRNNLIVVCDKTQRMDKWRQLVAEHLEVIRKSGDEIELASWEATTAKVLLRIEACDEAEPHARSALDLRKRLLPGAWQLFNSQSLLGGVMLGQGKLDEAEPLLLAAIAGLDQERARIPPVGLENLIDTLKRLVRLYEAKHNPDETARWQQRLNEETAGQSGKISLPENNMAKP